MNQFLHPLKIKFLSFWEDVQLLFISLRASSFFSFASLQVSESEDIVSQLTGTYNFSQFAYIEGSWEGVVYLRARFSTLVVGLKW